MKSLSNLITSLKDKIVLSYKDFIHRKDSIYMFHRNWDAIKASMIETVPEYLQPTVQTQLDSQYEYNNSSSNLNKDKNGFELGKLFIDLIPRVAEKVSMYNLIGLQPIAGPVGLTYHLQYIENDDDKISLELRSSTCRSSIHRYDLEANVLPPLETFTNEEHRAKVIDQLSQKFANEIDRLILSHMVSISNKDPKKINHPVRIESNFNIAIEATALQVAGTSLRGPANFMLVPKSLISYVMNDEKLEFEISEIEETTLTYPNNFNIIVENPKIVKRGRLTKLNIDVYMYSDDIIEQNDILLGYKGNTITDQGFTFCPYIPFIPMVEDRSMYLAHRAGSVVISNVSTIANPDVDKIKNPSNNYFLSIQVEELV